MMSDAQISVTDKTTLFTESPTTQTNNSIFNDCWIRWNTYSLILWLQILFSFIFSSIQLSNNEYINTYNDKSYDRQLLTSSFFFMIAVILIFIQFTRERKFKHTQHKHSRLKQIACLCLIVGALVRFLMIHTEMSNLCNPVNNNKSKHHCNVTVYGIRLIYVFFPILYAFDSLFCFFDNTDLRVFINSFMVFVSLLLYTIGQFYFDAPTWVKREENRIGRTGLLFILISCLIICIYSFMLWTKWYIHMNIDPNSNGLIMMQYVVFVMIFIGTPFAYFAWADIHPDYSLNAYQGPNTIWVGITIMIGVDVLYLNS
eukprot:415388_1